MNDKLSSYSGIEAVNLLPAMSRDDGEMGSKLSKSKGNNKLWGYINSATNALLMVLSVILFILASAYLFHAVKYSGMVLSCILFIVAVIGISDFILFKSLPIKTLYFVSLAFLLMMFYNYNYQVDFTVADACMKAELYLRVDGLQNTIAKMKTDEMMYHVYMRMDELEHLMDMVSTDVSHQNMDQIVGRQTSDHFISEIDNYVRLKLEHLSKHGDEILESLDQKLHDLREKRKNSDSSRNSREEDEEIENIKDLEKIEQEMLDKIKKVKATMKLIIDKKKGADLDIEDYETLLEALNESANGTHKGILKERQNLPIVASTMDKKQQILYLRQVQDGKVAPVSFEDWQLGIQQRSQRQVEFWHLFKEHTDAQKFHEDVIDRLPMYCVREFEIEPYLWWICWGIIILLCIGMYTMFTTVFLQVSDKKSL